MRFGPLFRFCCCCSLLAGELQVVAGDAVVVVIVGAFGQHGLVAVEC